VLLTGVVAVHASALGQTATTTSLVVTSGGNSVSSVSAGSMITLTASVTTGANSIKQGQVNFCDATAAFCTDVHLLGTAQLNSSGKAQLNLRPGAGSYSYKVIFPGTPKTTVPYAASVSNSSSLVVTGLASTATTIMQSGSSGDYTLTANVFGFAKSPTLPTPSGTVSFLDTTTNSSSVGTANLTSVSGSAWINIGNPAVGNGPSSIVTADFNNDGNLDLAVSINTTTSSVAILLGDGKGNFTPVTSSPITAAGSPVLAQDFNQDGIPDLLLSNGSNGSMVVLLGKGDGTFTEAPGSPLISNYGVFPVMAADFNGDGIPDLAAAGGYYLVTWLGNGDGSFTEVPIVNSYSPADSFGSMVVGDYNGDGKADIATPSVVLLGNGDGTFTKGSQTFTNIGNLALGDFNGDGKLDLSATSSGNAIAVFLGKGDGTFQAANGSPISGLNAAQSVAVGDFNGDGIADLIVDAATNMTDVYVLLGHGDGTFTLAPTGSLSLPCCFFTVVGDFNGDGLSDFASSDFYNSTADVFLTAAKQSSAAITGVSVTGPTPQNVIANYSGDTNYSSSQSAATGLLVQAATPAFTPASGGVIAVGQAITLTSSTSGVGIYYQASGALSTNGSYVQYTTPIPIYLTGSVTIQAYASSVTYGQSATSTATYTVIASGPIPTLSSLTPPFATAGGNQSFSIILNGSGFTSMSAAYWAGTAVSTQFVSTSQLAAQVTSTQVATAGVKQISVQTPAPGGGTSNVLQFEVDTGGGTPPSFTTASASVSAGSTATYPVTIASSATNVSVSCLNLPTGASCAYSASSGALTIATASSTPPGTYQITAVFTETLPGASVFALAAFLLPFAFTTTPLRQRRVRISLLILFLFMLLATSCGGGGSNGNQSQTHQISTSGVVQLTVQ
jgi:hypothetical protein